MHALKGSSFERLFACEWNISASASLLCTGVCFALRYAGPLERWSGRPCAVAHSLESYQKVRPVGGKKAYLLACSFKAYVCTASLYPFHNLNTKRHTQSWLRSTNYSDGLCNRINDTFMQLNPVNRLCHVECLLKSDWSE